MLTRQGVAAAIARLDPASRALLELSVRRGLSEREIGDLLGMDAEEIAKRRQEAFAELGADLGVDSTHQYGLRDQLSRLEDREWRGEVEPPPEQPEERGRRPTAVAASVALLVLAAVGVIAIALGSGDDGDDRPAARGQKPVGDDRGAEKRREPKKKAASYTGPVRTMERLNDTRGRGTAQLRQTGDTVTLRLRVTRFLRPRGGGYAVWLYSSRNEARRLYATTDTSIERDIRIPRNFGDYTYVEVARAIPRLTSEHSGLTLLRVPVTELRTRR